MTKMKGRKRVNTELTFWNRVEYPKKDCWTWKGTKSNDGYGRFSYKGQIWSPHRLAWTLTFGKIPEGLFVCHKCDNPPCINPNHLFLGTTTDNIRDASKKGRLNVKHNVPFKTFTFNCVLCNKEVTVKWNRRYGRFPFLRRFCSNKCAGIYSQEKKDDHYLV